MFQSFAAGSVRSQSDKGPMRQQGVRADQGGEAAGVHIRHARRAHDDFFHVGDVGGKKAGHLAAGSDDPDMPDTRSAQASPIHGGTGFLFGKKKGGKKGGGWQSHFAQYRRRRPD